jgi:predicted lipase
MEYYKVDADYPTCGNVSLDSTENALDDDDPLGDGKKKSCRVHSGFYDDWIHVKPFVFNATLQALADHPGARVWVTGHSLGGAIACLSAVELAVLLQRRDVGLLTFGEPRVGNVFFAAFVREWVPAAVRVVHQDDAVPHLPPQGNELLLLTAFHHHGTEVWQTGSKDNTFVPCDASGEDPHCSDSLLPWDRSVEAHRWYLGWPLHCEI